MSNSQETVQAYQKYLAEQDQKERRELRDRFAMAALTGLLAYPDGSVGSPERFSATAYEYADAMLKARGE